MKKGYIPKHFAIYRYKENMKGYFSRYKFMGDYCLRKNISTRIKANLKVFLKKGYILVPVPLSEERLGRERIQIQLKGL